MKKLLIPLLLLLASCGDDTVSVPKAEYDKLKALAPETPKPEYPKEIYMPIGFNNTVDIILVDSCEYITYSIGFDYGLFAHKGNCKFCEKRMDKRFEDLYNRLNK
jgi:hypothetical protein